MEEQEVQNNQEQLNTVTAAKKLALLPSNKLALIIIVIVVVILGTIILLLSQRNNTFQPKSIPNQAQSDGLPQASIYFDPGQNIGSGMGKVQNVKVMIDTQGREINRAVVALQYDPKVLSNVTITQVKDPNSAISNSFGKTEIFSESKNGLLSLTLTTPPGTPMQKGRGQVAIVSFIRISPNPTTITFASNSGFTDNNSNAITVNSKGISLGRLNSN